MARQIFSPAKLIITGIGKLVSAACKVTSGFPKIERYFFLLLFTCTISTELSFCPGSHVITKIGNSNSASWVPCIYDFQILYWSDARVSIRAVLGGLVR